MRAKNLSQRQHPNKQQIYGDLRPVSFLVVTRMVQFAGDCYRAKMRLYHHEFSRNLNPLVQDSRWRSREKTLGKISAINEIRKKKKNKERSDKVPSVEFVEKRYDLAIIILETLRDMEETDTIKFTTMDGNPTLQLTKNRVKAMGSLKRICLEMMQKFRKMMFNIWNKPNVKKLTQAVRRILNDIPQTSRAIFPPTNLPGGSWIQ